MENRLGGGRKHCFVNFCSLAMLEFSVDEGGGGGGVVGGGVGQKEPAEIVSFPVGLFHI